MLNGPKICHYFTLSLSHPHFLKDITHILFYSFICLVPGVATEIVIYLMVHLTMHFCSVHTQHIHTFTDNSSIFKMRAVMMSPSITATLSQTCLCPTALNTVQPNGHTECPMSKLSPTCGHCWTIEAQLGTHHSGITRIPQVITYGAWPQAYRSFTSYCYMYTLC